MKEDEKEMLQKGSTTRSPPQTPTAAVQGTTNNLVTCATATEDAVVVNANVFEYVFEGVPVIREVFGTAGMPSKGAVCDLCHEGTTPHDDLFRPCHCTGPDAGPRFFHRRCFRSWRTGWITPQNYFRCPDCSDSYRIERVKDGNRLEAASKSRIARHFRIRMALFYLGLIFGLAASVAIIAGIAYGSDTSDKNVPVAVKYMLTGVFSGMPPANATSVWREQFKQPNVPVWPYYTLLGAFCTSVVILIWFCGTSCADVDEDVRGRRSCSRQCGCGNADLCDGPCYCRVDCCYCNPDCGSCHHHGGDCNCGSGGGGDDLASVLLVLVLIVIVVVLVSAIVVVIVYAVKRIGMMHDRMTDMIECQARELESETIVLGVNETLRPTDAV